MNLTEKIESAEHKFTRILEDFFVSVYDGKRVPSHGLDHHRRVWQYARELLLLHDSLNISSTPEPSDLIIACYLHDIGMSADHGPKHGKISRETALRFLKDYHLNPGAFTGVLEAIENHDRKDYSEQAGATPLLIYLSLADDLDAFGYTGVYRYAEIYLLRGIHPAVIGLKIRENAAKRFDHFSKYFSEENPFLIHHKKEYQILDNFFSHYNIQVQNYAFDENEYCND